MIRPFAAVIALSVVVAASCVGADDGGPAPGTITIDVRGGGTPLDQRLYGTNLPAWVGPERLADERLHQQVIELGATVVRMPGGSWSNHYDWQACEVADASRCFWTWAARPTDFIDFLQATDTEGMWTVSFNGTAQEAAAAVAFFNGELDDTTVIGPDRHGRDWGTVGDWARLRADGGNPEPQRIELWEVGNEIFGAESAASGNCADWGWENVWTCDGAEYVQGDADHDGLVDFLRAMRAVDPEIEIGAVGVHDPSSWTDFGNDVLDSPEPFDFYVVHDYGFDDSPSGKDAVQSAARKWPHFLDSLYEELADRGLAMPVALTEYNLVSFEDGDDDQMMTKAANALFLADTIGQMAEAGVAMANQWNLVNGRPANGTDYGMIDAETGALAPQYHALAAWTSMTGHLLPVTHPYDVVAEAAVYATVADDRVVRVLVINKSGQAREAQVSVEGMGPADWTRRAYIADGLDATTMSVEGPAPVAVDPATPVVFAPYSITVLEAAAAPRPA